MGLGHLPAMIEVTVTFNVAVSLIKNEIGQKLEDFFKQEISEALIPDQALMNTMLEDAGLPLEVVATSSP